MRTEFVSPASILFGKTRREVLSLFFLRPTERFHVRAIARRTGTGIGPVQRELAQLTAAAIILPEREGNHLYYRANRDNPIFHELQGIILKTVGAAATLQAAMEQIADEGTVAFLYGSMARGEQQPESDIDVVVISETLSLQDLVAAFRPVQEVLGREINPMLYRPREFREKRRAKHHFLARVMTEPKVFLIGDADELG